MPTSTDLADLRRALGPVGVFVGVFGTPTPIDVQRDGVRRLESAGYRAAWTNEIVGADAMVRASLWLAATQGLIVGTSIANMWARPSQTVDAAATQLSQAYPGRFVLGLGVGNPDQATSVGREFGRPLATARTYLQTLEGSYPRLLGAIGPKMLALAAEVTDGALPAGAPPEATAAARTAVGADKLLVVYAPIQATDDADSVVATVTAHRDAGADHVIAGMSFDSDFGSAIQIFERLAPDLTRIPPG